MDPAARITAAAFKRPRRTFALDMPLSLTASACGSAVFILLSYLLLACVPETSGSGLEGFPRGSWIGRFDLAQLLGTTIHPPYPTNTTWVIGIILELCVLTALGIAYCLMLAWGMKRPGTMSGIILGLALYVLLGIGVWTASGIQPAVMRNAIPDTGFFLLGWSGWASLAILISSLAYGACVGGIYRISQSLGSS